MKRFNYYAFQDMDYAFTTAMVHPLSLIIRGTEAGIKGVLSKSIGSHEGRLIALECAGIKVWHIWEMMPGRDGQPGDLKLHPLSSYLTGGIWAGSIIAVKRNPKYADLALRAAAVKLAMELWHSGKVKYDIGGCGRWNKMLGWLKDSDSKFYCSEISEFVDQVAGGFSSVGLYDAADPGKHDDATPWMHQQAQPINVQVYQ